MYPRPSFGDTLGWSKGARNAIPGADFSVVFDAGKGMFKDARKQRTRRVQLHVGLRKGSPGEFTCTQSLPLVTLLDGPKRLATRFLGPDSSVVFDAG